MSSGLHAVVKRPEVGSPAAYARRVHQLAAEYTVIFCVSLLGIALIVWQGHLLIALSQRSNVETLTLAFFLVFFGYLTLLAAPGALGTLRIVYYALRKRFSSDKTEAERRKAKALPPPTDRNPVAALNVLLEKDGEPGEPIRFRVADDAGEVCELVVEGAELRELQRYKDGSNSLLAFVAQQVNRIFEERGATPARRVDIISWKLIDDEATEQHLGLAQFARRLERHLGADELWPKVKLTDRDCQALERRLSEICSSLRDEVFLPDWEYHAQHKLPLIPEPLGLVQLTRGERRADPVTSMGCAALIVLLAVIVLALIIIFPPWVPGR